MPWLLRKEYSFNSYLGKDETYVDSIGEAKEFKTKKSAIEYANMAKESLVVVKKTKM